MEVVIVPFVVLPLASFHLEGLSDPDRHKHYTRSQIQGYLAKRKKNVRDQVERDLLFHTSRFPYHKLGSRHMFPSCLDLSPSLANQSRKSRIHILRLSLPGFPIFQHMRRGTFFF